MNQKLIVLLSVSVVVALFIIIPTDAYGVNTLKNVINFTGTYPAGVDEFDVVLGTTMSNVSKAFSFMTFSHATDNNPSDSNRSWELIDNSTSGFTFTLYKTITINATEVDEDVALYGHSLDIIDTDLRDKALASGNDIIFTDNTGTTQIPHEIEFYNSTDGHLTAWVGVANVSSTVDTTYRMWYSSPTATNTENPAGVWDSDYIAVWHLGDDDFTDSTGVHDGTNHGTTDTTGQIDGARFFPDDGSDIDVGGDESNFDGTDWTFSTWASRTDNTAVFPIVFTKMTTTEWEDGFGFIYQFDGVDTGTDVDGICTYAIEFDVDEVCFTPPSTFDLTHLVSTFNGTDLVLYANGTEVDRTVTALSPVQTNLSPRIGQVAWNENGDDWNGKIDELTASSIARSTDYITTKHCDQQGNSFCPFDSVGAENIGETFEIPLSGNTIIRIFGHSGTPANNDAVDFVGHVVEYTNDSDMFVQHESFTFGASTAEGEKFNKLPVAINSSSTMILGSGVDYDGVNLAYGSEEFGRWRIVNNTDWGYFVQDTPATGDNNVFAQIIDWNVPTVRVQTGNATMLNDVAKTLEVTPPIAVQPNRTMFIASYDTAEGLDVQSSRVLGLSFLQADGDMLFNKDDARGTSVIDWQLVEFLDSDIFVIHNSTCTAFGTLDECDEAGAKLATGTATFNMPLPPVNVTESVGLSPLMSPFGFSNARTEGGDRGRTDNTMLTFELTSPTNLLMTRGSTTTDTSVGFEVITWGDVRNPQTFDQEVSDIVTVVDLSQNMNITKVQTDTTSAGDTVSTNGIFVIELSDTGEVVDVTSLNITKLNTDTVTALDETNFNITKGLIDTATILDLADTSVFRQIELLDTTNVNDDLEFAITKALTDLSTVLDDPDKDIEKTIADITIIIDQAEPAVIRQILELDTVTASDEVRLEIIKAIIDVVANSDDLNFSLEKILSDTAVVSDLIDSNTDLGENILDQITADDLVILDVTRQLSDVASAFDDLDLVPTKVFLDTTSVSDTVESSKASDVTETDPVVTQDDLIIDVTKLIQDVSTVQDDIVLLRIRDIAIDDTVTVTDPNIFFNFIPAPPTNGTGGGTGSSSTGGGIPSFQRLVGLSIESELFFTGSDDDTLPVLSLFQPQTVAVGNEVPSDFIISTFGRDDTGVQVKEIETDLEFQSWFLFPQFPQTLNFETITDTSRTINDPARFQNTALQDYILTPPAIACSDIDPFDSLLVACIDPIIYEIPITFTLTKGSSEFDVRHIVTVDNSTPVTCDTICQFANFLVVNWYWLAGIVVIFMMLYLFGGKVVGKKGVRTVRRIDRKAFSSFEASPKRKFKRGRR